MSTYFIIALHFLVYNGSTLRHKIGVLIINRYVGVSFTFSSSTHYHVNRVGDYPLP